MMIQIVSSVTQFLHDHKICNELERRGEERRGGGGSIQGPDI